MTYQELMTGIVHEGEAPAGSASLITQDSRKVERGAVFVCVRGRTSDGHAFAQKALQSGAGLIVAERDLGLPHTVLVHDTRSVYSTLCQKFFGNPADKLTLVGVTGTNGKTTISSVLCQVLESCGHTCGLIGTIHSRIRHMEVPARFTTPEPWDLNALFSRMVKAGCTHVVMEASSQALEQGRLAGLRFALGIFTNLTRDHLDYHGNMESYFHSKEILFEQCDKILINADDEWGQNLFKIFGQKGRGASAYSYSAKCNTADYVARNILMEEGGVRFDFIGDDFLYPVYFPMPGGFSVSNALAVGGGALLLGCPGERVAQGLFEVKGVRGRSEIIYNGAFTVITDFAHTADAIDKLLSSLKPKKSMLVVYGCAGDRDPVKRPAMSEAVLRYADFAILTSDNPRTENPDKIIADAMGPLWASGKPYLVEQDREKAVRLALDKLEEGDMLVLCSKGHEDYQVMDGYTLYLNEREIVNDWLRQHGKTPDEAAG